MIFFPYHRVCFLLNKNISELFFFVKPLGAIFLKVRVLPRRRLHRRLSASAAKGGASRVPLPFVRSCQERACFARNRLYPASRSAVICIVVCQKADLYMICTAGGHGEEVFAIAPILYTGFKQSLPPGKKNNWQKGNQQKIASPYRHGLPAKIGKREKPFAILYAVMRRTLDADVRHFRARAGIPLWARSVFWAAENAPASVPRGNGQNAAR